MGKCQSLLLDNPNVTLQTTTTLNPVTLLLRVVIDSDLRNYWPDVLQPTRPVQPPLADFDCGSYTD